MKYIKNENHDGCMIKLLNPNKTNFISVLDVIGNVVSIIVFGLIFGIVVAIL